MKSSSLLLIGIFCCASQAGAYSLNKVTLSATITKNNSVTAKSTSSETSTSSSETLVVTHKFTKAKVTNASILSMMAEAAWGESGQEALIPSITGYSIVEVIDDEAMMPEEVVDAEYDISEPIGYFAYNPTTKSAVRVPKELLYVNPDGDQVDVKSYSSSESSTATETTSSSTSKYTENGEFHASVLSMSCFPASFVSGYATGKMKPKITTISTSDPEMGTKETVSNVAYLLLDYNASSKGAFSYSEFEDIIDDHNIVVDSYLPGCAWDISVKSGSGKFYVELPEGFEL